MKSKATFAAMASLVFGAACFIFIQTLAFLIVPAGISIAAGIVALRGGEGFHKYVRAQAIGGIVIALAMLALSIAALALKEAGNDALYNMFNSVEGYQTMG